MVKKHLPQCALGLLFLPSIVSDEVLLIEYKGDPLLAR
jgi:hypothetical protein